ncbi:Allergen V5/Tpx-1-related [Macleaya cordata]|uniref:Allergen V5/Tpx-1-related n=1 Tax=Macleaya cordata TaxID=56857 RepID=A0A200R7C3_MACCD|nr:Allergen V5/Tpx-1-related [Macleaya cordata]
MACSCFMQQPHHFLVALVALATCTTFSLGLTSSSSSLVVAPPPLQPSRPAIAPAPAPHPSGAPPMTQPKQLSATAKQFLMAHNRARAAVRVGPLKWSDKLAFDTSLLVRLQRNNHSCNFADMSLTKYGMNQMWASGMKVTPSKAVGLWLQSKRYYNYAKNTCAPRHQNCGVYKQVVWKKSLEVGCAQATCAPKGKENSTITICLYHPPGNVIGERPY